MPPNAVWLEMLSSWVFSVVISDWAAAVDAALCEPVLDA